MAKRKQAQKNDDPALQSIWRSALGKPEGIRIRCNTPAEAKRIRFALYNAVRHLRDEATATMADPQLVEAVASCGISVEEGVTVLVQDKQFSPLAAIVRRALEEYSIPVKSEVADAAAASLAKLKAMGVPIEGEEAPAPQTEEDELRARARAKANAYYGKQ